MVKIEVSVETVKSIIRESIRNKDLDSIFLWGEPGVGKTSAIYQLAQEMDVLLIDKKLSQENPATVVGLFYPDVEKNMTFRLPRKFIREAIERDKQGLPTIIFLDELINAHPDVVSAIWELINEKLFEGYKLSNLLVIGAGNELEGKVQKFNPALWSRFVHFRVIPNINEVSAYLSKICPHTASFIVLNPNLLIVAGGKFGFRANPRMWERVARYCCQFSYPEDIKELKIKSAIDPEYTEISEQFLSLRNKILKMKPPLHYLQNLLIPKELDELLFLLFSIPKYDKKLTIRWIEKCTDKLEKEQVEILIRVLLNAGWQKSQLIKLFDTFLEEKIQIFFPDEK